MMVRSLIVAASLLVSACAFAADSKAVKNDGGEYLDADGNPTYNVQADGTVDFYTYKGFVMYHAECHVCHGPDAMGSTYAPALKDSLKTIDYDAFLGVISSGQRGKANAGSATSVMPAFGDNKNVMCVADMLYAYLRSRSDGALDRGRPAKHEDSAKGREYVKSCLGG